MADVFARIGPSSGTGAEATLVTGSAAGDIVILYRVLNTNTTTSRTFTMSVGADAAGTRLHYNEPVLPLGTLEWQGNLFLASGETLRWNGHADLTLTGTRIAQ